MTKRVAQGLRVALLVVAWCALAIGVWQIRHESLGLSTLLVAILSLLGAYQLAPYAADPKGAPPPAAPPPARRTRAWLATEPKRPLRRVGDVDVGGDSPDGWRPPSHVATAAYAATLCGRRVLSYTPDYPAKDTWAQRIGDAEREAYFVGTSTFVLDEEEADDAFPRRLDALLADPQLGALRGLLIGAWGPNGCFQSPAAHWEKLAEAGPRLTSLTDLFLGDVPQEESEISWIAMGDVGPLLSAIPSLQHAWVRASGEELRLSSLRHAGLRHLTVQTGGLSQRVIDDLTTAELPELRSLVLWLGHGGYGNDIDPATLPALLSRFPRLVHLGLQNAEEHDAVLESVIAHPVLRQLKSFDLSMGTLSDRGARLLLDSGVLPTLSHLNLRHHYITDPALRAALQAAGPVVNIDEPMQPDDGYIYVEVSE